MTMYFESDYDKNLREQRINEVYALLDKFKASRATNTTDNLDIEKDILYSCKGIIMQLVYLAKYINTHEQLPQEHKDLMNYYALQIEKVMGDKL